MSVFFNNFVLSCCGLQLTGCGSAGVTCDWFWIFSLSTWSVQPLHLLQARGMLFFYDKILDGKVPNLIWPFLKHIFLCELLKWFIDDSIMWDESSDVLRHLRMSEFRWWVTGYDCLDFLRMVCNFLFAKNMTKEGECSDWKLALIFIQLCWGHFKVALIPFPCISWFSCKNFIIIEILYSWNISQ